MYKKKKKTTTLSQTLPLPCVNMTKIRPKPTNVNVAIQDRVQTPMLDAIVHSLVGTMLNKILSFFLKALLALSSTVFISSVFLLSI